MGRAAGLAGSRPPWFKGAALNISFLDGHLTEDVNDRAELYLLGTDKGTGITMRTMPNGFRSEELILKAQFDHMDNSPWVKGGLSPADRAHAGACPAVKTPAGHFAARHRGHFKLKSVFKIILGYSQWILLFV